MSNLKVPTGAKEGKCQRKTAKDKKTGWCTAIVRRLDGLEWHGGLLRFIAQCDVAMIPTHRQASHVQSLDDDTERLHRLECASRTALATLRSPA